MTTIFIFLHHYPYIIISILYGWFANGIHSSRFPARANEINTSDSGGVRAIAQNYFTPSILHYYHYYHYYYYSAFCLLPVTLVVYTSMYIRGTSCVVYRVLRHRPRTKNVRRNNRYLRVVITRRNKGTRVVYRAHTEPITSSVEF